MTIFTIILSDRETNVKNSKLLPRNKKRRH
jgi:hypothetical protein